MHIVPFPQSTRNTPFLCSFVDKTLETKKRDDRNLNDFCTTRKGGCSCGNRFILECPCERFRRGTSIVRSTTLLLSPPQQGLLFWFKETQGILVWLHVTHWLAETICHRDDSASDIFDCLPSSSGVSVVFALRFAFGAHRWECVAQCEQHLVVFLQEPDSVSTGISDGRCLIVWL